MPFNLILFRLIASSIVALARKGLSIDLRRKSCRRLILDPPRENTSARHNQTVRVPLSRGGNTRQMLRSATRLSKPPGLRNGGAVQSENACRYIPYLLRM